MIYANHGRVRRNQIFADVSLFIWCLIWAEIGHLVFKIVNTLRAPAESLSGAASSLGDKVQSADSSLPGFLQGKLGGITGDANSVSGAADNQANAVTHVASVLGWTTALIPIVLAVLIALFFRIRWYRRVKASTRFNLNPNWEELLARRAVMHQPLGALARVSKDPLADLDNGHFRRLAALELEDLGINPVKKAY